MWSTKAFASLVMMAVWSAARKLRSMMVKKSVRSIAIL